MLTTRAEELQRLRDLDPWTAVLTISRDDLPSLLGITFASDKECDHVLMRRLTTPS